VSEKSKRADELKRYQKERSSRARSAVLNALREIDIELAERGYYRDPEQPENSKRLTLSEIQKRAGVSDGFLRNIKHRDLRKIVQDWLLVKKQDLLPAKAEASGAKPDTISYYESALRRASSDAQVWLTEKKKLQDEISRLEKALKAKNAKFGMTN